MDRVLTGWKGALQKFPGMGAKEDFLWIGSIRCLWGIMALWLPAMLVGFAVGLVFGKALWGSPTLVELGGDRPAWLEEEVGKLVEGLPAPIDDASRLTILGSASAHHQVTQTYPWPARLLAWLLVALLMPLLASSLAQHGMDRRSNTINLGLLLGLSGFSGVAGFGLLRFQVVSALAAVLLMVGIAVSLLYNWFMLWKLDDL